MSDQTPTADFVHPVEIPGKPVMCTLAEFLGAPDPEIDAAFKADMEAIREAERQAWIASQGVWLR